MSITSVAFKLQVPYQASFGKKKVSDAAFFPLTFVTCVHFRGGGYVPGKHRKVPCFLKVTGLLVLGIKF